MSLQANPECQHPSEGLCTCKDVGQSAALPALKWSKTKDDPEIHTAEVSPIFRYFLIGVDGKYIACYSRGTAHKVIGYIHTAGTMMETMEEAKERCERHRTES